MSVIVIPVIWVVFLPRDSQPRRRQLQVFASSTCLRNVLGLQRPLLSATLVSLGRGHVKGVEELEVAGYYG